MTPVLEGINQYFQEGPMPIDFEFTEEQQMFRDTIRDFGENEIAPLVEAAEKNEKFPKQIFPKLGEMGFLGISFPEEY